MRILISLFLSISMLFTSLFSGIGDCTGTKRVVDTDPHPITAEWKQMVKHNYDEFISEVSGNQNRIPIIVSTDQHGAISAGSGFYKYIDSIVDWNRISKIINLGDTVSYQYDKTELMDYRNATKCLPADKRIEVAGNHDRAGKSTTEGLAIAETYFKNEGARKSPDGRAFTVTDKQFGIRYLAVDTKNEPWGYGDGKLTTSLANYIVEELERSDSTDIVLLSHPYIFRDSLISRDGSTFTGLEYFIGDGEQYNDVKQSFIDMLNARKNKSSGILIDCEGKSHSYDFSGCNGDFLMTLHGHHHTEGYETKDGITEFLFQSMTLDNASNSEPNCFYFAYIDTQTKTFKCWKNVIGYSAWEISIA